VLLRRFKGKEREWGEQVALGPTVIFVRFQSLTFEVKSFKLRN